MSYGRVFALILSITISLLVLVGGFNFVVDPYNVNRAVDLGLAKDQISYRGNYRLYKLQAYRNSPCPNIYLGDSRMDGLREEEVTAAAGERYFNFAYGGGTAYEILDTFWYATKYQALKNVYIGINFNLYNANPRRNLVPEAKRMLDSLPRYYLSPFVTRISFDNILYRFTGTNLRAEKPPMNKEAFWKEQLGASTEYFYRTYQYPQEIHEGLQKIVDYCKVHKIHLVFVIPPTHIDLQNRVDDFHLREAYDRYKADIRAFGCPVFDFDVDVPMNHSYEHYKDPYHADEMIRAWEIQEVWGLNHEESPFHAYN